MRLCRDWNVTQDQVFYLYKKAEYYRNMCVLFRYADPAIGLSIFVIVLHAIAGMIAFQIEIKENYGEEFKKLLT